MAKTRFKSVDGYIASRPAAVRAVLERVRGTIRNAIPGAEEMISYNIPAYKLHGEAALYFAGWKQYYSLYPATDQLVGAFKDELAKYNAKNRTIRFPFFPPVPAKFLAKEVSQRKKVTGGAKRRQRRGAEAAAIK